MLETLLVQQSSKEQTRSTAASCLTRATWKILKL